MTAASPFSARPAPAIAAADFRDAMARLGAPVSLITTDGAGGRAGFTASAVCSVTDQPPTLLVCMNRASQSNPVFHTNRVLCVNLLAPAHQALSARFADKRLPAEARFDGLDWSCLHSGAPALDEALLNVDCEIVQIHAVGSHDIFYCEVLALRHGSGDECLAYFNRAYHHLGAASRAP